MSAATLEKPVTVAMFNVDMIGHCNPTFALVQELVQRGCQVHYFLPHNPSLRQAARSAGAIVEGYQANDPDDFALDECGNLDGLDMADKFSIWPLASTLIVGDHLITRCRELRVDVVVYDPMLPHPLVVAQALEVPCISLVTYPGMGSLASLLTDEALAHKRELRQSLAVQVEAKFGVRLDSHLMSRVQWLVDSKRGCNFVTTIPQLEAPLPAEGTSAWADEVRAQFPMRCVGCMASDSAPHVTCGKAPKGTSMSEARAINSLFPEQELRHAKHHSARIILIALGTMAVCDRWDADLGTQSGGNLPAGTTGKAFCHHVWRHAVSAMRQLGDAYFCVLCVGQQADALDFLDGADETQKLLTLPSNIVVKTSINQVQLLSQYAHAFITHGGFNSLQESLIAGVPLIAVPQAVDQPANARKIEASGWGRSFLQPMDSVREASLFEAIRDVASPGSSFCQAVADASGTLSGGHIRAAEQIIDMTQKWQDEHRLESQTMLSPLGGA